MLDAIADGVADHFAATVARIAAGQIGFTELISCAAEPRPAARRSEPAELYKAWISYNPEHPFLYAMYFNYAVALTDIGDFTGAAIALRETIRLRPEFCPPYINLGALQERLGHPERAVGEWMALVNLFPTLTGEAIAHKIMALKQIGRIFETGGNDTGAEDVLKRSLDIDPDQPDVIQHLIALRQRQCKWPVIEALPRAGARQLLADISPLSAACFADDPLFQLATAQRYNRRSVRLPTRSELIPPRPPVRRSDKLRIGYVSSDLRAHAVGFGMTEVIELHDRREFEVFAYYCGIQYEDSTQTRIKQATDRWTNLHGLDDRQAAQAIAADGVDILVDLNGYTKDARTGVFALRPAPINVNWFGFPGTMGSPYHHYIIADPYVIPETHELFYSEKVVRLPCYQPNDRRRSIAPSHPSRQEVGLPEDAMVFCCLNGMQKLNRAVLERWMRILREVPDGVLWLLTAGNDTDQRIRQLAGEYGVAAERIVFAARLGNADHLARYALADLLLDTMPYGSHTSASDALWMGVPVLTLSGRSFASRVCGSLIRAAGLEDLTMSGGRSNWAVIAGNWRNSRRACCPAGKIPCSSMRRCSCNASRGFIIRCGTISPVVGSPNRTCGIWRSIRRSASKWIGKPPKT
jgi:predicted O-linked N-acetylglucosamine transferase (SPINDLY family)